jgi:hypothetical protein
MRRSIAGSLLATCAVAVLAALPMPAQAGLNFNVSYDSSTTVAPAGFFSAFDYAVQFLESKYADPITINMQVGWGEINGNSLSPGALGQSSTNRQGFYSYAQMKTAVANDATTASDNTAVAHLAAVDPYNGASFNMANAEAKALGLLAGDAPGADGYVGFNNSANWAFDPNHRAVGGSFDFVGVALHEITEVMGRYGVTGNGFVGSVYSPLDLFRYKPAGGLAMTPVNGTYFSIDGGITHIHTYNGTGGGDYSDWSGATNDSLNAFSSSGVVNQFSADDIQLMDVIGYNLVVPEPSTYVLAVFALAALAGQAWRMRKR